MPGAPDSRYRRYASRIEQAPGSPVFAMLAEKLFHDGQVDEAIRLLEKGLSHHPEFTAARILLSRIYAHARMYRQAREVLEIAERSAPDSVVIESLKKELTDLELSRPPFPGRATEAEELVAPAKPPARKRDRSSRRDDLFPDFRPGPREGIEESAGHEAPPPSTSGEPASRRDDLFPDFRPGPREGIEESAGHEAPPPSISGEPASAGGGDTENELERLARILESARIPGAAESDDSVGMDEAAPEIDLQHRPATETLAEIYAGQGRIEEAVEMLLTLCVQHPDRRERLIKRIAELQLRRRERER